MSASLISRVRLAMLSNARNYHARPPAMPSAASDGGFARDVVIGSVIPHGHLSQTFHALQVKTGEGHTELQQV